MPELPEVQTTANGITKRAKGFEIIDVWTIYNSSYHKGKDNIKDPKFFSYFKKEIIGTKIIKATRRAKNILIHLSNKDQKNIKFNNKNNDEESQTILIHMKMTGHIMFGQYFLNKKSKNKTDPWQPIDTNPTHPLNDPFNKYIRLVFTLKSSAGKISHLVLSDLRKFAKITLIPTKNIEHSDELRHLGPEPLDENFTFNVFNSQLEKRGLWPVKQALLDQTLIAGIGNIYSDEILWQSGVHPKSHFSKIPTGLRKKMFKATKELLLKGIDFGGDSMSDYRNIDGLPGNFQNEHKAYRRTGKKCLKRGCGGKIERLVIGGRSGHFCNEHQVIFS